MSVLGCITVDGPRNIHKVSPSLNVRSCIGHLSNLSTILAALEPVEGEFLGWRFAQPHRSVSCSSAVKYWFESQSKIRCIPWPSAAEQFLPMKKVWLKAEEELNYRVLDGVNLVEDLWSHVSEVWPKVTNDTTVRNAIFEIPERCADYVNGHGIVE